MRNTLIYNNKKINLSYIYACVRTRVAVRVSAALATLATRLHGPKSGRSTRRALATRGYTRLHGPPGEIFSPLRVSGIHHPRPHFTASPRSVRARVFPPIALQPAQEPR
jgi:hypothetical protein